MVKRQKQPLNNTVVMTSLNTAAILMSASIVVLVAEDSVEFYLNLGFNFRHESWRLAGCCLLLTTYCYTWTSSHAGLIIITVRSGFTPSPHHCVFSLSHWCMFIYKATVTSLQTDFTRLIFSHSFRSQHTSCTCCCTNRHGKESLHVGCYRHIKDCCCKLCGKWIFDYMYVFLAHLSFLTSDSFFLFFFEPQWAAPWFLVVLSVIFQSESAILTTSPL